MLIEQLLESVRRVKYVEVIRTLKLSNRRADPNDDLFDPLKAAILCQRRRNIQDVKSNMVFGHFLNQQQRGKLSMWDRSISTGTPTVGTLSSTPLSSARTWSGGS